MLRSQLLAFLSTGFLISLSMADLIGVLTASDDYPEIVTAVITNVGSQHVTVLKHNTVFDTSHQSMPCQITTVNGRRLKMGGSRLMYSGMERSDFFDLVPGTNFTRNLNMTEYIGYEWNDDKETPRTVVVSLFPIFKGLRAHDGFYEDPLDAFSNVSPSQPRLGDLSKVNLEDIYVNSAPLRFTLPAENKHSHDTKRENISPNSWSGIKLSSHSTGGCTPEGFQNFSNFILQSAYLAQAAKNAAANFNDLPFSYFMPATIEAANIVGRAMDGAIQAKNGQGPAILGHCSDIYQKCGTQGMLGYAIYVTGGSSDFQAQIVLCPAALELGWIVLPCSRPPGSLTGAYVLLHEMMHIDTVSGVAAIDWPQPNGYENARNINANVLAGKNTTTDAAALAMLGNWAWDLGLATGTTCMQNWAQANFYSVDYVGGTLVSG